MTFYNHQNDKMLNILFFFFRFLDAFVIKSFFCFYRCGSRYDYDLFAVRQNQTQLFFGDFRNTLGRFQPCQLNFEIILQHYQPFLIGSEFRDFVANLDALNAAPGIKKEFADGNDTR